MGQVVSLALGASILTLVLAYYARVLRFIKLRDVRGPSNSHSFFGQVPEVVSVSPVLDEWVRRYGRVFRFYHFLNVRPSVFTRAVAQL
jgi:hypothetical protein